MPVTYPPSSININTIIQGADPNAEFVLVANTGSLGNARQLAAGPGVTINDYGAGSILAISSSALSNTTASYIVATASSGLPNSQLHELLQQVIHLSDDDGPRGIQWPNNLVKDTDSSSPFPSGTVWWTDSTRTKRIVDSIVTRNSNKLPTVIKWRAYASDGVSVVESYTDTVTYSGVFETSRTRSQP